MRINIPLKLLSIIFLLTSFQLEAAPSIEKIMIPYEKGLKAYSWPKLYIPSGWYQDTNSSYHYNFNALAPIGKTFSNAGTVMYARSFDKNQVPEKNISEFIKNEKSDFKSKFSNAEIKPIEDITTKNGKKLTSVQYISRETGNWDGVTYSESDTHFFLFAISSRTKQGYLENLPFYAKMISESYK